MGDWVGLRTKPVADGQEAWYKLDADYRFGKRVFMDKKHEFDSWNFLQHHRDDKQWEPKQSTSETRFFNGFNRRNHSSIPRDEQSDNYTQWKEIRKSNTSEVRMANLKDTDKRNGYNIITGALTGTKEPAGPRGSRRHLDESTFAVLKKESEQRLRNGSYRFFGDLDKEKHVNRKRTITAEGLDPNDKYSSILGVGRAEMGSSGVNDNFGSSLYYRESPSVLQSAGISATRPSPRVAASPSGGPHTPGAINTSRGSGSSRAALSSRVERDHDIALVRELN